MKKIVLLLSILLLASCQVVPCCSQLQLPSTEEHEINFVVSQDSEIVFKKVFLYGMPQEGTPFYGDKFTIKVEGETWTIEKDGQLISSSGNTIIPEGANIQIISKEGLTFLPEMLKSWANSIYDLFEVKEIPVLQKEATI